MTISVVQSVNNFRSGGSATSATLALTLGSAITSGNAGAVSFDFSSSSGTPSVTSIADDKGNTYTASTPYSVPGTGFLSVALTGNLTNAPTTITITIGCTVASSIFIGGTAYEVAGLGATPAADVAPVGSLSTFGTGMVTDSFTTTTAAEFALAAIITTGQVAVTMNNSWTLDASNLNTNSGVSTAHIILSSSGSNSLQLTPASGSQTGIVLATWAAGSSGSYTLVAAPISYSESLGTSTSGLQVDAQAIIYAESMVSANLIDSQAPTGGGGLMMFKRRKRH